MQTLAQRAPCLPWASQRAAVPRFGSRPADQSSRKHTCRLRTQMRAAVVAELALINADYASPSLWLGVVVCTSGLALYTVKMSKGTGLEDAETVTSSLLVMSGCILCLQGWRLDPILMLSEAVLAGVGMYYIIQTVELRKVVQKLQASLSESQDPRQQQSAFGKMDDSGMLPGQSRDGRHAPWRHGEEHASWPKRRDAAYPQRQNDMYTRGDEPEAPRAGFLAAGRARAVPEAWQPSRFWEESGSNSNRAGPGQQQMNDRLWSDNRRRDGAPRGRDDDELATYDSRPSSGQGRAASHHSSWQDSRASSQTINSSSSSVGAAYDNAAIAKMDGDAWRTSGYSVSSHSPSAMVPQDDWHGVTQQQHSTAVVRTSDSDVPDDVSASVNCTEDHASDRKAGGQARSWPG